MAGLSDDLGFADTPKDISAEELMHLKTVLLNFEKVFDDVEIGAESKTYDGDFLLEMLEKAEVGICFCFVLTVDAYLKHRHQRSQLSKFVICVCVT